ncbi:DNA repair protein RAD50 [Babesia microti strain RI]|uniref:DNA repair protein RAD50 n=1 Tax=Babesia microti (strain RI) TaxID=1133968 RepID=A0A1N6LX92_BABMR|nr:DNA repair protein RAD50 [Babesia microti strain RI]SIO73482.1 DNA repair protein RAD50 [Babesia microti strain RI]|eukprot:XP_021337578.1 DNA repair protein RAD50 [Babesia microti strain RI]
MIGIQGIRSFSPEKMETLRFEKPLTLIVGHNGSGKTTLIECLKVATTGELPPNVDKGKNFIHDPKIDNVPEVRAQIKLTFKAFNGNMVCATRIYQLLNVKDKIGKIKQSFKALESVLQVKLPTGEESCVSHKCVDMDIAVPSLIGLSKAVLDSVIFCHQENNTWPLSDNATVKKRFDDLFQTSRYVKALEAIGKARKEQLEVKKDKNVYLHICKSNLSQAKDYEKQLSDYRIIVEDLEQRISEYESDEFELSKKIENLRQCELNFMKVKNEIEKINAEINNTNGRIEELKSNLTEEYQESLDELLQLQVEFNAQLNESEDTLVQLDMEIDRIKLSKPSVYSSELWITLSKMVKSINEIMPTNLEGLIALKNKLSTLQSINSVNAGCFNNTIDNHTPTEIIVEELDHIKNLSQDVKLNLYNMAIKEINSTGKCILCRTTLETSITQRLLQTQQFLMNNKCEITNAESISQMHSSTSANFDDIEEVLNSDLIVSNGINNDIILMIDSILELSSKIDVEVEMQLNEVNNQRAQVCEKIINDKTIKRVLVDNIKLKTLQQQNKRLQDDLMILSSNVTSCESEMQKLTANMNVISSNRHECMGSLKARRDMIKEIEMKLESPLYKNAKGNFMDAQIQLQTVILAEKDLAVYQKSLDLALTKYHYKKMEEINIAIKSIWQELYTGNDIDYIAVRFNEETDKSFHYRIVMSINGTELDMRGRCSAGQRMLASLVIRLALAEIFCQNCGILALDEPTTNLDVSHVKGLGESLARLVNERKSLHGFQLILITHDEEFASKLALDCGCHRYYKIDKKDSGSAIVAITP